MRLILLALVLLSVLFITQALQVDLKPGDYKCVGQELDQEDTATFLLGGSVLNSNAKKTSSSLKLSVAVIDPSDEDIINERLIIGNRPKEFKKTIAYRGVYTICFSLDETEGPESTVRAFFHVDTKSRTVIASELDKKLGKSELNSLETQLKSAEDLLLEISKEFDFSRRQEMLLREAGDAMTARIHKFGYLSIGILVFSSLWQLIYLRRFFISKKVL